MQQPLRFGSLPPHQAKRCQPQYGLRTLAAGCVLLTPQPAVRLRGERNTSHWQRAHKPHGNRAVPAPAHSLHSAYSLWRIQTSLCAGLLCTFLLTDIISCWWKKKINQKRKGEKLQGVNVLLELTLKNSIINVTAAKLKRGFSGQMWFCTHLMQNPSQVVNHKAD